MDQEAVIEPIENEVDTPDGAVATEKAVDIGTEADDLALDGGSESPSDEETKKEAPAWVTELRKQNRELKKQLKERAAETATTPEAAPELGQKPSLESCDFDAAVLETKLDDWYTTKAKVETAKAAKALVEQAESDKWNATVGKHNERVRELAARVPKAAEYVSDAELALSPTQKGMIVHTSPESHRLLAVLGKNPKLLEEVSSIKDPALFVRRVVEVEMSLTGKKPRTAPERVLTGVSTGERGTAPGVDAALERLETEADRTGDRSKIIKYRRELANKAK